MRRRGCSRASGLEGHDLARPEAAALFEDVELATVAEEQEVTADEHVAFVRTTSAYLWLDSDGRRALEEGLSSVIAEAGGRYARTEYAALVMARIRAASRASASAPGYSSPAD
jgi:hypothetical protein